MIMHVTMRTLSIAVAALLCAVAPDQAHAYIGPGAGFALPGRPGTAKPARDALAHAMSPDCGYQ